MAIEAVARQVEEFAPAKVNLTLHVTGQRRDGYHLLDSLVVFADVGDVIRARSGPGLSLRISGPRGAGLSSGEDNLVLRAARSLGKAAGAELQLEKHLPVASGIGGGSADAAATLRALSRLWRCPLPADRGLSLGADVPVCVDRKAVRMTGVGEGLAALRSLPDGWLVLVNPGVPVSTPAVFRAMHRRDLAPMPRDLPGFASLTEFAVFLRMQRNDMQAAATMIAPVIAEVEAALSVQPGCLMARMSGSGATCFGLFADPLSAAGAARAIQAARPDWWAAAGRMMG